MNYKDYIVRNTKLIQDGKISNENDISTVAHHVRWANQLSDRLDKLDPEQRQIAMQNIINVMNDDYKALGFIIDEDNEITEEIPTMGGM